jgi:hypothetical protein
LGSWTTEQIRPLFSLFKNDQVAPALALLIFLTAVGLCILFLLKTTYIRIQIKRRTRNVRQIRSKSEFITMMPRVETLMMKSAYLRHSWEKFRETVIEPLPNDPINLVILNTTRPQDYFNMADAGLQFPIYRALPNLLVGIGLLLTFFDLVSALFFTTDAIKNANAAYLAGAKKPCATYCTLPPLNSIPQSRASAAPSS